MSLTLRLEELNHFRVSADLGSGDGRISLALKSSTPEMHYTPSSATGVLIHFETVVVNGRTTFNVFTSDESANGTRISASATPADVMDPSVTVAQACNIGTSHLDFQFEGNVNADETASPPSYYSSVYTLNIAEQPGLVGLDSSAPSIFEAANFSTPVAHQSHPSIDTVMLPNDFNILTASMHQEDELPQELELVAGM
ncbi:hypothetical protein BD410DRAFT_107398 [Rickenella mellea]|uniref:Uncharacterized protein n=1 Tax=Rickenella mellea TaxID=50990 RepID=A0A4Y7PKD2_9AGAM|nr:hypothetical protein BD410DRAFT_107398 [Rickenella mellea]